MRPEQEMLIAQARSMIGTPYQHAQCSRVACDCVGLIAFCYCAVGLLDECDIPRQYSPQPNEEEMRAHLSRWFVPVSPLTSLWQGDVLLFNVAGRAQHVGIYAEPEPLQGFPEGSIIHAYQTVGRVVEHSYEKHWKGRTTTRYRWKDWF